MVNDTKNLLGGSVFYQYRGGGSMYYSPIDYTIAGANIMWEESSNGLMIILEDMAISNDKENK